MVMKSVQNQNVEGNKQSRIEQNNVESVSNNQSVNVGAMVVGRNVAL